MIAFFSSLRIRDSLGYVVVALIGAGAFFGGQGAPAAQLLLQTFLIAEALMGSIFCFNNRFDRFSDRAAGSAKTSRNPVSAGLIGLREIDILSISLTIAGLLGVVIWFYSAASILLYVAAWTVGIVYSAPPLRLKSRPGLDILSHGAVVVVLFILGLSFAGSLSPGNLAFSVPFLMLSTIYELRNHLKDWAVDTSAGLRTTVTSIGLERGSRAIKISTVLFWVSLLGVGYSLGNGMLTLVATTLGSYIVFTFLVRAKFELIFDAHLWAIGGIYSAFRLLVLAGLR